jgi:signal transduction histidine kinase
MLAGWRPLGLPITYSIAKKHGGDLELLARPEGGTEAVLRFPLVEMA